VSDLSWAIYVWTANFGRGVSVPVFQRNALEVMKSDHEASCATCIQELDEADKPDEHAFVKELAGKDHLVGFQTHVPIVVARRYTVRVPRVKPTSEGVPHQSPRRNVVSCRIEHPRKPDVPGVALLNNHAPRNTPVLREQIKENREEFGQEVWRVWEQQHSYIWAGDMNDQNFPKLTPGEKTAVHAGLDYIRYRSHPKGAQLELLDTGTVDMDIDGHNAHWAKFRVSARAA